MKKNLFLLLIGVLLFPAAYGQKNYTLSGTVKDIRNGEFIDAAAIIINDKGVQASTNKYGFYSVTLAEGTYSVKISHGSFQTIDTTVTLTADVVINFEMKEANVVTDQVNVNAKRGNKNVTDTKMGAISLDIKTIMKVPVLLGEVDIMKVMQLLPGVQAAGDGNTLSIVRGGNTDHNLVLLDEAVVYNPTHVIGFFSIFNGDAVKDFELFKGGIPAQYGGRLASVMDVRMREGNMKKYSVSGGVGLLFSRLTVEGPLKKDTGSFMVSARRSYFDILFFKFSKQLKDVRLYFGDLNVKANYTLNSRNRIYISAYTGTDRASFSEFFGFGYGNTTGTVRWNHVVNSKLFVNTSAIISRYNYNFDLNIAKNLNFTRINYINNYSLKSDFNYYITPKNLVRFGFNNTFHMFRPAKIEPITPESIIRPNELPKKFAFEQAYYISHKKTFSAMFNVEYGLRVSVFSAIGKAREFVYSNGTPTYYNSDLDQVLSSASMINDTINYNAGKFYKTYVNPEPRVAATYLLSSKASVKASYNRMAQYLNLIQNTTATTGQEIWVPAGTYIKPQLADQFAAGYFRNLKDNAYETSVELYYKHMQHVPEIIDNAQLDFNEAIESVLTDGKGRSYGAEFFVRKIKGKFQGWVSYTLSKSERQTKGINNGEWYNFRFDRRHYLNVVGSYDITKRLSFGGAFIFATGQAVTVPVGSYEINGVSYPLYSARNSFRIPPYHRLDLSITLNKKDKPNKRFKNSGNWVFSVYNVYARKNYFSLSFRNDGTANIAEKTYLFRAIPSITYNFKF